MSLPTDARIVAAQSSPESIAYRTPMKFGGRVVTEITLLHVQIELEGRDGRRAVGRGSMPIGNVWAWPTNEAPSNLTAAAMTALGEAATSAADQLTLAGHPLDLAEAMFGDLEAMACDACRSAGVAEAMPRLAQLVSVSPIDAALHDAYGRLHSRNSYDLLGAEFVARDLAHSLNDDFAGEYLDRYTLRRPKDAMPLYHLVGALDPLTDGDVEQRLHDGLPETLGEWIAAERLTHLKIKLAGDDLAWDVDRVCGVEAAAAPAQAKLGRGDWRYSCDFNEKCENVEYVLEFLRKLAERCPAALERVQYIEQPTHRDLAAHPENKMHAAAAIKPVVIDESLVDLESLLLARELGYSGVALKACKGHGEALLMGAAAQKYDLFLCVQDLTCPGASFLHSASLSARIPTVAAIEGNARQYCPSGNDHWRELYPEMFVIDDGVLETRVLDEPGLGFHWPAEANR